MIRVFVRKLCLWRRDGGNLELQLWVWCCYPCSFHWYSCSDSMVDFRAVSSSEPISFFIWLDAHFSQTVVYGESGFGVLWLGLGHLQVFMKPICGICGGCFSFYSMGIWCIPRCLHGTQKRGSLKLQSYKPDSWAKHPSTIFKIKSLVDDWLTGF